MGNWNQLQEVNSNDLQRLRQAISLLMDVHSRRMSEEAMTHWVKRLSPYAKGKALWAALERACDEKTMPSVGWILEQMQHEMRQDLKPPPVLVPLTPAEQKRSDNAAMLSMLWLHYNHGWDLMQVGQHTIGRVVARQLGVSDLELGKVLSSAKEAYPKEMVLQWMRDQQAAGN